MSLECRFCCSPLCHTFCDLGKTPLANSFLNPEGIAAKEPLFPLIAYVCSRCFLVQLPQAESPEEIFSHYAYFSSYSTSWLNHARHYAEKIPQKLGLHKDSFIVEIASNDGYLLNYFQNMGYAILGIEPAKNVAQAALEKGIPTRVEFFSSKMADTLQADLLIGNNVLAHVPDLNDFIQGLKIALKPQGWITLEFPHLLNLIQERQFDTIYHEHFSYFSLLALAKIFPYHGLEIVDVEKLPTHGGSLRLYVRHAGVSAPTPTVTLLIEEEREAGLHQMGTYELFGEQTLDIKQRLIALLRSLKLQGKKIVGYGAPAKGNTLLNFCGLNSEMISYTVDKSRYKQGLYLPGSKIPIFSPEKIFEDKPDYILILPWNLKDEIVEELKEARTWGGKFICPIPYPYEVT